MSGGEIGVSEEFPLGGMWKGPTDEWLASIGRTRRRNARGEDIGEITSSHEDPVPVISPLSDDLVLAIWNSHRYELWTTDDNGVLKTLLVKGNNIIEKLF